LQRFLKLKNIVLLLNLEKMKKLVLLLAVVFSVSLFSCGGAKTEAAAEVAEVVDTTAVDTCCADTCCADTVVADSVK